MKGPAALFGLLLLAGSWHPAVAQNESVRVEGRAGSGIPTGALAEMVDPGPAVGLSAAFPIWDRLAAKADATGELFQGGRNVQAWHLLGGLEASLVRSDRLRTPSWAPWSLTAEATVGASFFTMESGDIILVDTGAGPLRTSLLHPNATVGVGLKASRLVAYTVALFAEARAVLMLTHADDAPGERLITPGFGPQVSMPFMMGLRIQP